MTACSLTPAVQPTPAQPPAPTAAEPTVAPTLPPEPTTPPAPTATPASAIAATAPASVPVRVARFVEAPCPFRAPTALSTLCGFVTVPEDHANPAGPTIRLAVAVFKPSGSGRPPDPVVLLAGGPGEKVVQYAALLAQSVGAIYGRRDFVVFDQRGVGSSEPALECPEFVKALYDGLGEPDPDVGFQQTFESLMTCRDRLVGAGWNLSAYTTRQSAADVDAIRLALGYDKVNLYGASYGSVLAQAVMREYPQAVRSVVVDAVLPLDKSFFVDTETTASKVVLRLLDACAVDRACDTAYPDLKDVLFRTVDRLNATPATVTITHPLDGKQHEAVLTGDAVLGNLVLLLYQTDVIPLLPRAIADVATGDYALMAGLLGRNLAFFDAVSRGMQYSVLCTEDLIGRTEQEYLTLRAALPPQLVGRTKPEMVAKYGPFARCKGWPVKQADPSFKQPVKSDLPTLLLAGELDPVTPPEYARTVAANLPNSFLFTIPGGGHSVGAQNPCARQVIGAFLDNPTRQPDATCIRRLPGLVFDVPGAGKDAIILERVEIGDPPSAEAAVPKGWQELQPAFFARRKSPVDPTMVFFGSSPGADEKTVLARFATQVGIGEPRKTGERKANDFTWSLYRFEAKGVAAALGLAPVEGGVLVVLFQTTPEEIDALYDQVFLPGVDGFVPFE